MRSTLMTTVAAWFFVSGALYAQTPLDAHIWFGAGDGLSYNDPMNWSDQVVPDSPFDSAIFADITSLSVGVQSAPPGGTFTTRFDFLNSDIQFVGSGGTSFTLPLSIGPTLLDDPQVRVDNSQVEFDIPINFSGDTLFDLRSSEPFGFSSSIITEPINTNNHDLFVLGGPTSSALMDLQLNFFPGGNTGNVTVDGSVVLNVLDGLTANEMTVTEGTVAVAGGAMLQFNNAVNLNGGTLTNGASGNMGVNNSVSSSAGDFLVFGDSDFTISGGLEVRPGNTTIQAQFATISNMVDFGGPLSRLTGGTMAFQTDANGSVAFGSVPDAGPGGVLSYATYNANDFARYNSATTQIEAVSLYNPISGTSATDPAIVTAAEILSGDAQSYVTKLDSGGTLDGAGNMVETNAILASDFNNQISNATLAPPSGSEEIIFHAANGAKRLTLEHVDVTDNGGPVAVTFAGGGQFTVNDAWSKTGDTFLQDGRLILNGPDANVGGNTLSIHPSATGFTEVRLVDNTMTQDVVVNPNAFEPDFAADGDSTFAGDWVIVIETATERSILFSAPQVDDSLTLGGTFTRSGTGQGRAVVRLGTAGGRGTINIASTADLTDPNLDIIMVGSDTLGVSDSVIFSLDAEMGQTFFSGNMTVLGTASLSSVSVLEDGTTTDIDFFTIAPGSSIGTLTVLGDMLLPTATITYSAEIDDAGASDQIAVGGTMDISSTDDTLDISFFTGSTLASDDYTLATYGTRVGVFDTVIFDGSTIADPTLPGAIGGTHRLFYGLNSLLLTTGPTSAADFDLDGDVDGRDFLLIQRNNPALIPQWESQYGSGVPPLATSQAVPEPSSLLLGTLAILLGSGPGFFKRPIKRESCHEKCRSLVRFVVHVGALHRGS